MLNPFPFPPPPYLVKLTTPIADSLSLTTLPLHIHELLLATLFYHVTCTIISPLLSTLLFPAIYSSLPKRTRLNWDVHVVSLTQSLVINTLALWVMRVDGERGAMGWEERVWGYDGAGGMIQAFAAGYFLWDLMICIRWFSVFGWGLLAHAMAALVVFSLGFRPFVNFYGPTFILYELSSPFLNIHWFLDKLHLTGSRLQWYNGILLLASFFACRLLWGTYQSVRVYQDVWAGLHYDRNNPPYNTKLYNDTDQLALSEGVMRYFSGEKVPSWLAGVYLGSNIVLNTLNFYWFGKMIETVRSRFQEPRKRGGGRGGEAKTRGVSSEVGIEGMDGGEQEQEQEQEFDLELTSTDEEYIKIQEEDDDGKIPAVDGLVPVPVPAEQTDRVYLHQSKSRDGKSIEVEKTEIIRKRRLG